MDLTRDCIYAGKVCLSGRSLSLRHNFFNGDWKKAFSKTFSILSTCSTYLTECYKQVCMIRVERQQTRKFGGQNPKVGLEFSVLKNGALTLDQEFISVSILLLCSKNALKQRKMRVQILHFSRKVIGEATSYFPAHNTVNYIQFRCNFFEDRSIMIATQ